MSEKILAAVFKELNVKGIWLANGTFPKAVKSIESRILNLHNMVTYKLPLEKISEGINLLKEGKAIKVVINP